MLHNDPTTPIELYRSKLNTEKDRELLHEITDEESDLVRMEPILEQIGELKRIVKNPEYSFETNYVSRS